MLQWITSIEYYRLELKNFNEIKKDPDADPENPFNTFSNFKLYSCERVERVMIHNCAISCDTEEPQRKWKK